MVINKKLKLVYTEGSAEDMLRFGIEAKKQQSIEGTINKMLSKNANTSAYTTQTLNKFISEMELLGVSMIPIASHDEEDIKIHGGAIFKDFVAIGTVNEKENRAIAMMRGEMDRDVICSSYEDIGVSFLVSKPTLKKKIRNEDGNLSLDLKIDISGSLQEYILEYDGYKNLNDDILMKIEKAIEETLLKESKETLEKIQKEYKADLIYAGEYIYKFYPKIWNQVKDRWDEVFAEMDINLDIKVQIKRIGLTY